MLKQAENNPKWEEFGTKPCTMLKMTVDGRVASRGEIQVAIPIKELFEKLAVEDNLKKVNPQLKEMAVLHSIDIDGKLARVNYMRYHGIWPVEDRDLVSVAVKEYGEDVCYIANKSSSYPYPKVDKVTRAKCHIGGFILKKVDEGNTFVIYISEVDLAGSIPQMIQNKLSEKQASLPSRIEKALK